MKWNRDFSTLMAIGLLFGLTSSMANTTLPLYIGQIGGSSSVTGLAMGAFTCAALLARPFSGVLLDKKGRKLVLILGASIVTVAAVMYSYSTAFFLLLVARFIHGIGFSGTSTAAGTIVVDISPEKDVADSIGYFGVTNVIAYAVGPAMGLFVVQRFSFNVTFQLVAVLAFLALIGAFSLRCGEPRCRSARGVPDGFQNGNPSWFHSGVCLPALTMLLIAAASAAPLTYLAPYAVGLGISDIGFFFTAYASASFATRVFSGRLARTLGLTATLLCAIALQMTGYVILSLATHLYPLVCAGILIGFSFGVINPLINTIIVGKSSDRHRGAANALFFSALDVGVGAGAIVWGIVAEHFGYPAIFMLCVFVAASAAIPYLLLRGRPEAEECRLGLAPVGGSRDSQADGEEGASDA